MARRKRKKRQPATATIPPQRVETQPAQPGLVPQSVEEQPGVIPYNDNSPLRLRLYGDPVLRQKALPIQEITDVERKLADDMLVTMYAVPYGIGLAAPQVGVLKRLIVIDLNRDDPASKPLILINPEIESLEGESVEEEGCLSIPDVTADVKRAEKAVATALNLEGEKICIEGEGFLARALQHEIDHLDGVLFVDHLSGLKRQLLRGKLRKIQQQALMP